MNNNKGMSLIEVLVAVSVMSIMSFFIMDMISNQNKAIKTTQHSMDRNQAQNQIERYMLDGEICKQTLLNIDFPLNQAVPIPAIKNNTQTLLSPGHKIGGVEIESFVVTRTSATELLFNVTYKKSISGQSYGGDSFRPQTVALSAQFETTAPNTNKIKNCFSQFQNVVSTALQMACAQLCPSCTWNASTSTCVRPPGVSTAIYRNNVTAQLLTTPAPANFNVQNCYNTGSNHSYGYICGNARNNITQQCANQGATLTNYSDSHGGCGSGWNNRSCTARGTCTFSYTLKGYLTPNPY